MKFENVSKFIGHASADFTSRHYWVTTPDDLISSMNIGWFVGPISQAAINQDKCNSSSYVSGLQTEQIVKIATTIAEGCKAKKMLDNAVSIMTPDQIKSMESLWTEDAKNDVKNETQEIMTNIANAAATTITTTYSTPSSTVQYNN